MVPLPLKWFYLFYYLTQKGITVFFIRSSEIWSPVSLAERKQCLHLKLHFSVIWIRHFRFGSLTVDLKKQADVSVSLYNFSTVLSIIFSPFRLFVTDFKIWTPKIVPTQSSWYYHVRSLVTRSSLLLSTIRTSNPYIFCF